MANFMKKAPKVPKMPKPAKPIVKNEVTEEEVQKSAEEKLEVISEVIEEQKVVAAQEKIEEPEVEEVQAEEDDKFEDKAEEEIIEDANKEEVVAEEIVEEKPKAKAKSSKKKSKAKPVVVEEPSDLVMLSTIDEIEAVMAQELLPEPDGWKEEKERINELVNKTMITEELDPTSVRSLLQDMSTAYREIAIKAEEANSLYDNLQDQIKSIKELNYIGSNSEERKVNSAKAVIRYVNENNECVNLNSYLYFARARASFYNSALKNVETNRQMLITFSSVFKIELGRC